MMDPLFKLAQAAVFPTPLMLSTRVDGIESLQMMAILASLRRATGVVLSAGRGVRAFRQHAKVPSS